jgi:hypothetical protein
MPISRHMDERRVWLGAEVYSENHAGSATRSATVVDFVALRAPRSDQFQQLSKLSLQAIQSKQFTNYAIQQISIIPDIRFGTRGSEVQILSPRPFI